MTNQQPPDDNPPDPNIPTEDSARPDPLEVLRARAEQARLRRDASISQLRQLMEDGELLAEFGIDLSRLED